MATASTAAIPNEEGTSQAGALSLSQWRLVRLVASVTLSRSHLASEDPVGPGGVSQYDRDQEQESDQQEQLAARIRRGIPERVVGWNRIRPHTDQHADVEHRKQHHGSDERGGFSASFEPSENPAGKSHRRGREDPEPSNVIHPP